MKLQIASYELAKLAKEKGFNWEYTQFYHKNQGGLSIFDMSNSLHYNLIGHENSIPIMSLDLLCKWFRDVHNLNIQIGWWTNGTWSYDIGKPTQSKPERAFSQEGFFSTYELALEEALLKAFELI